MEEVVVVERGNLLTRKLKPSQLVFSMTPILRDLAFIYLVTTGIESCSIRPGIVHRLDKGTSGLELVAKAHTVTRVYLSLTSGVPTSTSGRVEVPIGRHLNNRIRMSAVIGHNYSRSSRHAASGFKHPWTGKYVHLSCPPLVDFIEILNQLRSIST
ncbi:RNA pseudouridine synthase 2 chloroplastic [Bienertia sinuspersici]